MAKQNRIVLKGYFNTGDTPTEEQFADLIDSFSISLSELGDINLSGLQDGFILAFNQGTNKWIVRNLPIPVYELSELDDVDLTGAIDTNVLVFSQSLNKWVPGSITIPMITAGDGLKKVGEIISLGLPSNLGATSVNSVIGESHSHSIDSSIARSERIISGGEGLIGGGDLTEDRVISLSEHTHQESGTSGGKLDHGLALIGLDDDDHPQYWNDTRGANKIDQHISADDHTQYWNDSRGNPKVETIATDVANTKVLDHNLIKTAHGLVSPSAINDFMIASGIGVWSKKTLEEAKSILGVINENDILAVTDLLYSPINHTHEVATTVEKGFMSPSDKSKLDGLDANNYAPIAHVGSGGSAHADVTTSVDGFMKAADKAKLDGLDANNYAPIGHVGSGGTAHADATTSVNGFLSAADKTKINNLGTTYAPIAHVGSGGSAHADVTTSVAGFMKAADKAKLDEIYPIGVRLGKTLSSSIPSGAWTVMLWELLSWEEKPASMSSHFGGSGTSRLTIRKAGLYQALGQIRLTVNTTGVRGIVVYLNGASYGATVVSATSGIDVHIQANTQLNLNVGDYLQIAVYQNSGVSLNTVPTSDACIFSLLKVG